MDPKLTHYLDQLSGLMHEVADRLGTYRARLVEHGVPEGRADEMMRRMEERILGPLLDDYGGGSGTERDERGIPRTGDGPRG